MYSGKRLVEVTTRLSANYGEVIVLNKSYFIKFFGFLSVCTFVGCGGGGGSDSGGGSNNNGAFEVRDIEVDDLSLRSFYYDEGDSVRLSLNTRGDVDNSITYDWEVSFSGQDYSFSGQGTPTIEFVAPEVTGEGVVSIFVDLGLEDGNLIGRDFQSIIVRVLDTDPVSGISSTNIEIEENSSLPEVVEINTTMVSPDTAWQLREFVRTPIDESYGIDGEVFSARTLTTFFESLNADEIGFRRCGTEVVESFVDTPAMSDVASFCAGTWEESYYQNNTDIRIEGACDGVTKYARQFSLLSAGIDASYGTVDLDFSSYASFITDQGICGGYRESIVTSYEDENNNGEPDNIQAGASFVEINGIYDGEPILISVSFDDADSFGSHFLGDTFDPDGYNGVNVVSPSMLNIFFQDVDTGTTSKRIRDGEIEVDINVVIDGADGNTERVNGEFTLSL